MRSSSRARDDLRCSLLALVVSLATWLGASPASSEEPWQETAAASVFVSSNGALGSDPQFMPAFSGLSLRAPAGDLPPSLDAELARERSWRAVLGPLGDLAAELSANPKLVVVATTPDEHASGARVVLQCRPPRCGALVLARF